MIRYKFAKINLEGSLGVRTKRNYFHNTFSEKFISHPRSRFVESMLLKSGILVPEKCGADINSNYYSKKYDSHLLLALHGAQMGGDIRTLVFKNSGAVNLLNIGQNAPQSAVAISEISENNWELCICLARLNSDNYSNLISYFEEMSFRREENTYSFLTLKNSHIELLNDCH